MTQGSLLLHAACILTQDDERRILTNASLGITGDRISAIGPRAELAADFSADRELDLGNALLMPGLINAHTHAAMTFLRGLADDLPLEEWLNEHIFPLEQHLTADIVRTASLLGYAEMLRTGTTACADMYLFTDAILDAARTAGIRATVGEAVFQFPTGAFASWRESLEHAKDTARSLRDDPRLAVMLCPHACYTTTPEILRACNSVALEERLLLQTHLAETAAETTQCREAFGKGPVAHMAACGVLRRGVSLAHVVHADDEDMALLQGSGALVAHCPTSNLKLASGVARVPAMHTRGIAVGLGTDGAASNNQLNMFAEMRLAALLHKALGHDPTLVAAQTALDMGTRRGSRAIGALDTATTTAPGGVRGQLRVGDVADLIALDLNLPNMQPLHNPVSQVVYAATGHEVFLTMVGGEILYHKGAFTRFDYPALLEEMQGIARWARKRMT